MAQAAEIQSVDPTVLGKRVLDRVNSGGLDRTHGYCPSCGTDNPYRHAKYCPLTAAARADRQQEGDG